MAQHVERVESFFHDPKPYLSRRYNIRIRAETVREMLGDRRPTDILDLGCGDGSLSLPLLNEQSRLTLVDVTEGMLAEARSRVPAELADRVTTILGDLNAVDLPPESFDLVLCMGVLAHVESPEAVIDKLCTLLRPGGMMIVTVSSGAHVMGWLRKMYMRVKDAIKPPPYRLKWLSTRAVLDAFRRRGLVPVASFRYNFPAPGLVQLLPNDRLYKNIRLIHGNASRNRLSWLGSECIFALNHAATPVGAGR
ncbi:MAG TPA: class I SAM-dependent methyltransferase [Isosphaeraceae bacterium]|nr:class I SAM-dependent methyltransferase [Isosphaeraceae bacterium]